MATFIEKIKDAIEEASEHIEDVGLVIKSEVVTGIVDYFYDEGDDELSSEELLDKLK